MFGRFIIFHIFFQNKFIYFISMEGLQIKWIRNIKMYQVPSVYYII